MTLETLVERRLQCGKLTKYFVGEFVGTYFLIFLVLSAGIQRYLVYGPLANSTEACLASGFAVAFAIYAAGKLSGAHVNPALSLAFLLAGKMSLVELVIYWLAQFSAALVASATAFGLYYGSLTVDSLPSEWNATSPVIKIFATYPRDYVSNVVAIVDQAFGSGLLIFCTFAVTDPKNLKIPPGAVPLCVGLTVAMLGMSLSFNVGGPINPARDLMPRVFAGLVLGGWDVFTYHDFWGLMSVPAQLLGASVFAFLYIACVGGQLGHQPPRRSESKLLNLDIWSSDKTVDFIERNIDLSRNSKGKDERILKTEI